MHDVHTVSVFIEDDDANVPTLNCFITWRNHTWWSGFKGSSLISICKIKHVNFGWNKILEAEKNNLYIFIGYKDTYFIKFYSWLSKPSLNTICFIWFSMSFFFLISYVSFTRGEFKVIATLQQSYIIWRNTEGRSILYIFIGSPLHKIKIRDLHTHRCGILSI